MKFSIHVCNVPCPEEYYMGVNSSYEAYDIDVPEENIPNELLDIMKGNVQDKRITTIAVLK